MFHHLWKEKYDFGRFECMLSHKLFFNKKKERNYKYLFVKIMTFVEEKIFIYSSNKIVCSKLLFTKIMEKYIIRLT